MEKERQDLIDSMTQTHFPKECEERVIEIYGRKFSVYSDGSVKNHKSKKRRFGNITDKGYKSVLVKENGTLHTVFVHRLVAMAFIPNPENKPQVNHKNGIKTDNRPCNLEWCTNYENRRHSIEVLQHYGRRKPVICVETNEVFESVLDASKSKGINRSNIQLCISNKRKRAGGYTWKLIGGDSN